MTTADVDRFEAVRGRLLGLAYRLLGSWAEAEDVVGDVAERWIRHRPDDLENPEAWLVTVTTRRSLDVLRSSRVRVTDYPGQWLPEPIATGADASVELERMESLTMAFLKMLEHLSPLERAVLVLRDALDYPYELVAEAVGRSEVACRQVLHRARRHVTVPARRTPVERERAEDLARKFVEASLGGGIDELLRSLAPEVVVISDGGGVVRAATHVIVGPARVARFLGSLGRRAAGSGAVRACELNGESGFVVEADGRRSAVIVSVEDDLVIGVYICLDPRKLGAVGGGSAR